MNVDTNLRELFGVDERPEAFDQVSITVASPDIIRSWSKGEVKNPETINYRTFKPEKGGLFCERIFGPTRDWECACGKYKRIKHKGVVCDRCGVEVTLSRVRRERMGHIELAVPVSHIWFYKCMPSRIGLVLDISARHLERVIYYEDYVVTEPGNTPLERGQLLTENELRDAEDAYGDGSFHASMGAEAIQNLLAQVDLAELAVKLEQELETTRSKQNKKKLSKRLKITQGFAQSKSRPEWMIQTVLPVIPPDLRPLVPLEGGRFATSDLNDLYRRVINRNNRLKNLLQLKTPEVIIRNEKRMLQEAVDALFDNGRHGRAVTGAGNRPLKSLSDMLKGKGGRFRQNLLGKRVDYSGRSVIVIGPDLTLNQCGLPKKMALTLFEPFIIRRLKELGYCHTVRSAKKMIDRKTTEVWDILAEVTKGHPVFLNRAPTLHRLSIQAFEPKLIEGEAIRVHPLVCTAYNADFDGDQMAVHVPLSVEAQMEARQLMLAPNNIFSPASGRPITVPSQDIILGVYYLTWAPVRTQKDREQQEHLPLFENSSEVEFAIASRKVGYHQWIRIRNPNYGTNTVFGDADVKILETTPGRVRFNEIWPSALGFINRTVGKKQISDIIWRCYQAAGQKATVTTLDALKSLGFREATRSGASIGIVDMVVPEEKPAIIADAYAQVDKVTKQYRNGVITDGERYQKVVDIWTHATDTIASALYRKIEFNDGKPGASPLFMMVDSGARGNKSQIKQLSGMRGLMAKPSGEIIERPITSNFREGLSVLEYFISTHGARKGLADTALKTADSGYMTRKLVDVAQDVIVTVHDCGTASGITVAPIYDGDEEAASLATRIYGRTSCEQVKDPVSGEIALDYDQLVDEKAAKAVERIGYEKLKIRSVLTCEAKRGCCAKCYGLNLATGKPVKIGEAVGIIAAQSIGEPGTQLTMRTFHVGGVAAATFKQPIIKAKNNGRVVYKDLRVVESADGNWVVLNKNGSVSIRDKDGLELESQLIVIGSVIEIKDGDDVKKGDTVATWDPYNVPILTEKPGKVEFRDMIAGITVTNETDKETGKKVMVVTEHKEDLHPQVVISDPKTKEVKASYSIPVGAHLSVKEGDVVTGGTQLAKTPRKVARTKDITGGLPRVAELFEARKPKDACVIAKIDGEVSFGGTVRGKKKVIVSDADSGEQIEHLVPMGRHIIVTDGDSVKRGDQITEGPVSPEDLLEACGAQELQEHLVNEVQSVYRVQGVEINDKHIEIIIRQMLRKVKITEPGDADQLLWGDQIDRSAFNRINEEIVASGGKPAEAEPVLLGITKASLETDSFISAASFQDTTRVLTEAATLGKVDYLTGFKENVIMGHLIPAGSGFDCHREADIEFTVEEPEPIFVPQEAEGEEMVIVGEGA
ncbi:MAG: DNA-directed RNA polymerase subunit beta' [Verrucomicrobia bacterium]|nr:MAG: DNA-directed RNA polymerase subunit beta' [Verrucomicrobiota bacterium]TAE87512.1 MAG: DNA-directed RNA polymerase subunit beta' [Verrucomicrobiota bacterium]TAF25793.1 MAG: DNA-directed RNA polymerase subunit beta' [Verrucomicrobiota bacterium]TAF41581.1 MAG: DNA-directed RNA polymerase subunit beta' [Verrucomicrobiota bacterium]